MPPRGIWAVFAVRVHVKEIGKGKEAPVKLIVDTEASLSVIPKSTLRKIGVAPRWQRQFTLANGEKIERDVGIVIFRWNGYEGASEVIFGEKRDNPLLGALTLEALGLKVNPRKQKLEPIELLLLSAFSYQPSAFSIERVQRARFKVQRLRNATPTYPSLLKGEGKGGGVD